MGRGPCDREASAAGPSMDDFAPSTATAAVLAARVRSLVCVAGPWLRAAISIAAEFVITVIAGEGVGVAITRQRRRVARSTGHICDCVCCRQSTARVPRHAGKPVVVKGHPSAGVCSLHALACDVAICTCSKPACYRPQTPRPPLAPGNTRQPGRDYSASLDWTSRAQLPCTAPRIARSIESGCSWSILGTREWRLGAKPVCKTRTF